MKQQPLQPATALTFPPRGITPEIASSLNQYGIARGPETTDPRQRQVFVLPSKLDEIIQKAQGRAAPVFRKRIKLYEKLIDLLQREIAATKKLTQLLNR
jgi:hypothetical protein